MYLNGRLVNPGFRFAPPWAKSLSPLRGSHIRECVQNVPYLAFLNIQRVEGEPRRGGRVLA